MMMMPLARSGPVPTGGIRCVPIGLTGGGAVASPASIRSVAAATTRKMRILDIFFVCWADGILSGYLFIYGGMLWYRKKRKKKQKITITSDQGSGESSARTYEPHNAWAMAKALLFPFARQLALHCLVPGRGKKSTPRAIE